VLVEQEKFSEAERVYLELVRVDPTSVEAYEGLGTLYYRQRQYDEARQTFEYLAKLHSRAEAGYSGMGLVAAERGDLGAAAAAYRHSVAANPKAAGNHYNLAKVHEALDDTAAALKQVQAALALEPENPRYLDYATSLAILQRDVPQAQELLERLATANPENQKVAQYRLAVRELYAGAEAE
jgi:tetratricopeptide (TPR) repeat protein